MILRVIPVDIFPGIVLDRAVSLEEGFDGRQILAR
jgi:hypothetical protein